MKYFEKVLKEKGLALATFEDAFAHAISLYKNIKIEQSERIKMAAAMSFHPGASVCDLGSFINPYPVVLALLGMRVTTVDYYPQAVPGHDGYHPDVGEVLDVYRSVGINVVESNLYEFTPRPESYDVVTSFETFEHLWQSPKPIMEQVYLSLRPGGQFVLSLPNIVRAANRIKMLIGHSPLPAFPSFYQHGLPFTGHRREMTIGEVDWMMTEVGLRKSKLFTLDLMVPAPKTASRLAHLYRSLTDVVSLPGSWRATIYAVYSKQQRG